ncbi:MAG TPA: hypothetical protein VM261_04535 [Kofleriaceae bacterium]|nr:hypothetical protein [Kofleriaceae bacterium]
MLALAGCVDAYDDDDGLDEAALGETEQELGDVTIASYGVGLHVVAPASHICFIAGVRGTLISTGFELLRGPQGWQLSVGNGINKVAVACQGPVASGAPTIYEWQAGDRSTQLGPYRTAFRCFLAGYGTLNAMNEASDSVHILYSPWSGWFLGGSGDDDTAMATAVCMNVTKVVSTTTVEAPGWTHVEQQVATVADNAICGISMIGGDWTQNPFNNAEARLHYSPTAGWEVYVDMGRKVTVVCVR